MRPLIKALLFIFLVMLLIFTNTQHIADRMFWLDEVITLKIALNSFLEIPFQAIVYKHQMQPPLYFWLGGLAVQFGTDPATLRSVSVCCYILLIGFIVFAVNELKLITRFFLCFVLIILPFANYAVTEFRPYALAVLSILVSSVFFYRLMQNPQSWKHAWLYFLSALLLQYSLTLNCFVFGVQIFFVLSYVLWRSSKEGVVPIISLNKPMVVVSVILCSLYLIPLALAVSLANGINTGSINDFLEHLIENFQVLKNSFQIPHPTLSSYLVIIFFIVGISFSFWFKPWVIVYLLCILLGQLIFSTCVTYATIPWFGQRYLTASYVAFALLTAIGAEYVLGKFKSRLPIAMLVAVAALGVMYSEAAQYRYSKHHPITNPSKQAIERLRCRDRTTIVLTDPQYFSLVPWYIYRNDESLEVPVTGSTKVHDTDIDIVEIINDGSSSKACFILQEARGNRSYIGEAFTMLMSLPAYENRQEITKKGPHVPASAWIFSPE